MNLSTVANNHLNEFIVVACVPLDASHTSGTLERANAILAAHPELGTSTIQAAAILGDDATVRRFLTADPASATAKAGPHKWDALTYLCFSKYLRLERARANGFFQAAKALLDAGASAKAGFYSREHQLQPEFESVLYGAAGIAHDPELTRLLLERGADANDGEVTYHTPEGWDNDALKVLVELGKPTQESLATMLLRKTDWHDCEGVRWLLENGADPNLLTHWGKTALHNAVVSDNDIEIFEALLDHGADPNILGSRPDAFRSASGKSALSLAARRGRGDVFDLTEQRGIPIQLQGVDRLIVACARNDAKSIRSLVEQEPRLRAELISDSGPLLAQFAGNGNVAGVRNLLELGVEVRALHTEGDGYFDIARNSTALHVAAWRARHDVVKLLLERGAPVDVVDGKGRTPLALAVRACVDSYWKERRSPESVRALLEAGASPKGITFPSGYAEVDELLQSYGAGH
jgi:ankyrin repeat protein